MTARDAVLAVCGLVALACGLLAVTSRQVVHAALWLVAALGALAGCYLALGAELVALVQVLVYVGAVVVLVLFALMLTRAPIGIRRDLDGGPRRRVSAAALGVAVAVVVGGTLGWAVAGRTVRVDDVRGGAEPLGTAIFTTWLLPFELLSLLLLAALVAAVALARGRDRR